MVFQLAKRILVRFRLRSIWQDFARFVAAQGDMRSELRVVLSLLLVILAVVGVFIEIPLVSNYAFWLAVGAYVMLAGTRV